MNRLGEVKQPIERLINGAANALKAEVAVFDSGSNLICGTPVYLKKKGKAVHSPSINEVMNYGSVLVNTPGEMQTCVGCRFKDNCPATVELLCCIKADGAVIGVVTLTSFTREGHARISGNTQTYLDALTELAGLIGGLVRSREGLAQTGSFEMLVQEAFNVSRDPLLLADSNGVITQYNEAAAHSLSFCRLSTASLRHILPETTVRKVLRGIVFQEKEVSMGGFRAKLTTRPIYVDRELMSVAVRFSDETYGPENQPDYVSRIIGTSPETQQLQRMIRRLADSPTPILICGETGTGKELAARAIHEQSSRRKYPFVAVNCSSVPETLFESELFGYEEGAFTGAKKGGKIGKIEMAQGGTLFLDELGELPLSMQPKLLRVLQEYELERVGSAEKIPLNIRVIAATNRDLSEMIADGRFRADLYYRIGVINLEVPPLRQRTSDILPIAAHCLESLRQRMNTPVKRFDEQVERLFLSYEWWGNVREVQNVVEYTVNLCENEVVTVEDLPPSMRDRSGRMQAATEKKLLQIEEQKRIQDLLDQFGYTLEGKTQIAKALGISLRTLYRKLERFGTQGTPDN